VHRDVGLEPISISCFPDDDTVATLSIVRASENIRVRFTGDRVHAHSSPSEVISQEGGISGRGRARQTVDDRDLQPVRAEASARRWDGAASHGQRADCDAEHDNDSHRPAPELPEIADHTAQLGEFKSRTPRFTTYPKTRGA